MSYEIYTADLSNRYEISHAETLSTQRLYNGIAKAQLIVAADPYNINAIEKNGLIYDTETGGTFTIQDVKRDTIRNQIVANCYSSNWLLNKRAVIAEKAIQNVEADVYSMVSDNLRQLPAVAVGAADGLTATIEAIINGGQLGDSVIAVLNEAGYGHRMDWNDDTRTLTFKIYEGRDLTPEAAGIHAVVFSEMQGTATDLVSDDDDSTFKNYFYIPIKYKDSSGAETQEVIEYGDPNVSDRREFWIKNTMSQEADETVENLRQRARWKCQEEAGKRLRRLNFSVKIDPKELGTRYDLGDKVSCVSERLGISFEARITGVVFKLDATGANTEIKLGEPTLSALGEVELLYG